MDIYIETGILSLLQILLKKTNGCMHIETEPNPQELKQQET
jgi:hypothetical protein